jgi:hypothetical protein
MFLFLWTWNRTAAEGVDPPGQTGKKSIRIVSTQ